MLKPRDTWNWYFDNPTNTLMLDLGNDMLFQVNLPKKALVDCAYTPSYFDVEDASAFNVFNEKASTLALCQARQAELVLNCVAAKRFHKPVQPKSWFFDQQGEGYMPSEGDIVHLTNSYSDGYFMVIEVCENASLCVYIEQAPFLLDGNKQMSLGEPIKVMHNRMVCANQAFNAMPIALVS